MNVFRKLVYLDRINHEHKVNKINVSLVTGTKYLYSMNIQLINLAFTCYKSLRYFSKYRGWQRETTPVNDSSLLRGYSITYIIIANVWNRVEHPLEEIL